MTRPALEVADIFRTCGAQYRKVHGTSMSREQYRAMRAIQYCRTAFLGGHIDVCDECGIERNSYNSCRNRHCPKCQSLAKAEWLDARMAELLPAPYYHVVFTIPEEVASVAFQNKKLIYTILFKAASETLRTIAADPSTSEPKSVFLLCYTPGVRPCSITLTCTAWFLAAACLRITASGSLAARDSFYPFASFPACSGGNSSATSSRFSTKARSNSIQISNLWPIPKPSVGSYAETGNRNGSSMPNLPLADPPKSSITSAAIPTALPSPTTA